MRADEGLRLDGSVRLVLWRGDVGRDEELEYLAGIWRPRPGRVLGDRCARNLVTNVGRGDIAGRIINGAAQAIPGWIAVGTNVVVPAVGDLVLAGELLRKACSTVAVLATYTLRFVANFTTGDFNNTVRGLGLFTAAAAGDMWCENVANVTKDNTQALSVDWRILVSAS